LDTPTASEAETETLITPFTVEPLDGEVIDTVGAVVSLTVTVKLPFAVLPDESVAEQLTVVVPRGKVEPEAGVHVTVTAPSTSSVAVAVYVTTAPDELVASTVMLDGRERVGAVVSATALDTFTVIWALDSVLTPLVAVALNVWLPSDKVVVSRLKLYGEVLSVNFKTLST
jgi:hypothetical protein